MINTATPPIFGSLSALADTTRARLLLLLERQELAVGDLCAVLQLPQSTVSRHLKTLADDAWVGARAEGTSRRYRMTADLDPADRRLWALVKEQIVGSAAAERDTRRLRSVLEERRTRSRDFFATEAGEWDRLRSELFGAGADVRSALGLLDDRWTVGDLGCGTGATATALAPFVARVIAVDDSPEMLSAAERRLDPLPNVEVRRGDLSALPLADGELDAALLSLVLHHVAEPGAVLREVARCTTPGGRIVIVDMIPHEREEYRERMGHVWLGFSETELAGWIQEARLVGFRYAVLPADPQAKGPTLFTASARRSSEA
ncbi:metalloregulator ArsR/SmtB family transcription factor [soil metagenome]